MTDANEYLIDEGYTEREAKFLRLVAEHSGFFTVAQYRRFIDLKAGKTSQRLVERVQAYKHAVVAGRIGRKSEVLRLTERLCEALEMPTPRAKEAPVRLQVLDYVIGNQNLVYISREEDKVAYFIGLGVAKDKLSRINEHYFDERMPIYQTAKGAGFVWIDSGSLDAFEAFLWRYAALFSSLGKAVVVYASTHADVSRGAKRFEKTLEHMALRRAELQDLEARSVKSLGGPELRRLRMLRESGADLFKPTFGAFKSYVLKRRYRLTN